MATHNIVIAYPDAQGPTIVNALKNHITLSRDGIANTDAITTQETMAWLDSKARDLVKNIVKDELRRQAELGVATVDIT